MVVVELNKANFEYDVHSLVKAFWAEEQVSVLTPESKEEKRAELAGQVCVKIDVSEDGAKVCVKRKLVRNACDSAKDEA